MTYNDKFQIFNYFLKIPSPVLEVMFLVKSQVVYIYIYVYLHIFITCYKWPRGVGCREGRDAQEEGNICIIMAD